VLNLKNVTLFSLAWGNKLSLTKMALQKCCEQAKFYDVVFLTPPESSVSKNPIVNEINYNTFMINHLHNLIKSEFCLVVQWDGFIIDANMWQDEFFEYDYIGASWQFTGCKNCVGNGGFSLRSNKFLQISSSIKYDPHHCDWFEPQQAIDRPISPEDWFLCYHSYERMKDNNINFAPIDLANRFSVENAGCYTQFDRNDLSTYKSFGFHYHQNIAAMNTVFENETTKK
jgi:hypothetical protein